MEDNTPTRVPFCFLCNVGNKIWMLAKLFDLQRHFHSVSIAYMQAVIKIWELCLWQTVYLILYTSSYMCRTDNIYMAAFESQMLIEFKKCMPSCFLLLEDKLHEKKVHRFSKFFFNFIYEFGEGELAWSKSCANANQVACVLCRCEKRS